MLVFGDDYWGKVDWVPGLFYIKTRFLHIWWFPLVPRQSILFLDENPPPKSPRGVAVPLRWKSVGLTWLHMFLLLIMVICFVGSFGLFSIESKNAPIHPFFMVAVAWSLVFLSGFSYWWSCRWMSPTREKALELGKLLGIPAETVELHLKITI
jgi:hypothetical protein